MTSWQLVWTRCKDIIAAVYSKPKFFLWKRGPEGSQFVSNFIENLDINLTIESHIKSGMKDIPQIADIKTLLVIILDSFNSRQFTLVDPIHEFPRSSFFVSNFLNFDVKKWLLRKFNFAPENFPIFQTSYHSITVQSKTTLLIPPTFGMSCDIDSFWICSPCIISFGYKIIGNFFKFISIG